MPTALIFNFQTRVRGRAALSIGFSLLAHALLLFFSIPHIMQDHGGANITTSAPLTVSLYQAAAQPQAAAPPPVPEVPRPAPRRTSRPRPKAAVPSPVAAEPPLDMLSMLNAARKRR